MYGIDTQIAEVPVEPGRALPIDALLSEGRPAVLRQVAKDWTLVDAGRQSPQAVVDLVLSHYQGRPVQYSLGSPDVAGRPFYTPDFTALNCEARRGRLDEYLQEVLAHLSEPQPPTHYLESMLIDNHLPGLRAGNDLDLGASAAHAPPSIWIGSRTTASCHYDAPNNIACCAVGRRRFTLFPPEQIDNLYPGPLDPTPGGQAITVVDFSAPDLDRHPRFAQALKHGQQTELAPGDAIFIPSMWWHQVECLDPFNILVNYWWGSMPAHIPTPMHALYHALWTIRDRPEREKRAWRAVFDYYVFGPAERAGEHLPEPARGFLAPFDEALARRMRAFLLNKLNR